MLEIILNVSLFASARQIVGQPSIELKLHDPQPTIAGLRTAIAEQYPELGDLLKSSVFAVNHEYAVADQQLTPTCQVALIPPVSGG